LFKRSGHGLSNAAMPFYKRFVRERMVHIPEFCSRKVLTKIQFFLNTQIILIIHVSSNQIHDTLMKSYERKIKSYSGLEY
jgi:hypothetical protein